MMQAMNTVRRQGPGRWLLYGYVVLSAAALVWLTASARQWRMLALKAREHQAQMVANTMLGMVQNLEAVPGVLSVEGNPQIGSPLENAESSIAQVEIATLGYSKVVGQSLPHGELLPPARLLILARQERDRDGKLSPETLSRLNVLTVDMRALWQAYPVGLLMRANPVELAAARAKLPELLKDPAAQAWLQQHP
jgi:hypothetical protein